MKKEKIERFKTWEEVKHKWEKEAEWSRKHPIQSFFYYLPSVIRRRLKDITYIPKEIRWKYQRMKQGYSTADTWSFGHYLSNVIIGGVKELRDRNFGYPCGLDSKRWKEILNKIIKTFENVPR